MTHRPMSRRSLLRNAGITAATVATGTALAAAPSARAANSPYFFTRRQTGGTVRVIMIADPWVDTLATLGADYEAATGVRIEVESFPYDQTHQREILLGTQQSDASDVICLDSPWVGEFAEAGIVEDLKSRVDASPDLMWDDFIPSYRAVSDWNGTTVGVPFAPYYVLLHYRKDLLEAEGLAAPANLDEWKAIAQTFTNNAKYPGISGVVMNNARGAAVGQAWFEYLFNVGGKPFESTFPGSPDAYSNVTPLINSPEGVMVADLFMEMLQYEPAGALNMAWDERAQAFASGTAAMMSEWSVRTPILVDPNRSQIADKFATTTFPALPGLTASPPLGGWVLGINAYSANKDAAWEFIKWASTGEAHKKFITLGGPPARLSELADPALIEQFPWFPTISASAATAYQDCRPRVPESFQIIDTIGNALSEALAGSISTTDAMNRANDDVRTLLEQSGYEVG